MKKMGLVALMALLCLPMGALAVREGVIEDAPMVEARRKTSYLPMHRVVVEETGWMLEEAYTEIDTREMSYDDIRANLTSNCRLTTGERKRMEKLMAAYAAGERTGDGTIVLYCLRVLTLVLIWAVAAKTYAIIKWGATDVSDVLGIRRGAGAAAPAGQLPDRRGNAGDSGCVSSVGRAFRPGRAERKKLRARPHLYGHKRGG